MLAHFKIDYKDIQAKLADDSPYQDSAPLMQILIEDKENQRQCWMDVHAHVYKDNIYLGIGLSNDHSRSILSLKRVAHMEDM